MNAKWNEILKKSKEPHPTPPRVVEKTSAEWKELLSSEEFHVTREQGTERPFSSDVCTMHKPSIYNCTCCAEPLFDSTQKFDSGTGWPSFTQPIKENLIKYIVDNSLAGRERIEVRCNICDSHLGHVFPKETNDLRYCINGVSIKPQS